MRRGIRRIDTGSMILVVTLFLGTFLVSIRVSAEDSARTLRATAQQLYEEGVRAFESNDSSTALTQLERSYELFPSLRTLFSIGLCQYSLSQLPRSYQALAMYLREGGDQVPPELREQATTLVEEMSQALAFVTIQTDFEGATILVDSEPFSTTPLLDSIALEPGQHVVEATLTGHQPFRQVFSLSAGSTTSLQLDFIELATDSQASEETANSGQAPLPSLSDVIMLRNGAFIRGTISVLVPNRYVIILTATGELRRFALTEVLYAGRADAMPGTVSQQTPVETPPQVNIRFEGTPVGLSFHRRVRASRGPFSRGRYSLVCSTPCDGQMEEGTQTFALSDVGASQPLLYVEQPVNVSDGMVLSGRITFNRNKRRGGTALVAVGSVLGVGLIAAAFATGIDGDLSLLSDSASFDHVFFWPFFLSGTMSLILFNVFGIKLIRKRDLATVSVISYPEPEEN